MKVWGEPPPQRRSRRQDRAIRPLVESASSAVLSPVDPGPFEADEQPQAAGAVADAKRDDPAPVGASLPASRVHLTGDPGHDAVALGAAALIDLNARIGRKELADPIIPAVLRFARGRGERVRASQLLAAYDRHASQSSGLDRGLPWTFAPDGGPGSALYARTTGEPTFWRPR